MPAHFATPTLEGFRQLKHDPATLALAVQGARTVINTLHELLHAIQPLTIIALAQGRHPDAAPCQALALLLREVQQTADSVKQHHARFDAISQAERERLAPLMKTATRRVFALVSAIEAAKNRKSRAIGLNEARRKQLLDLQLTPAEVDTLAPPVDDAAMQAEIEQLQAELAALEAFTSTTDERHLPAGFAENAAGAVGTAAAVIEPAAAS